MRGPIANLMQQAQKMQENMQKAQAELANLEVVGQSGGGMVKITMSGRMDARRVQIDPQAMGDAEMLEDLIAAAFNDAVNKVNELSSEHMGKVTAGMPIPPGMKIPGLF